MPVLLLMPFILIHVWKNYSGLTVTAFVATILSLTIFNHFFILYIKRKTIVSGWWLAGSFAVLVLLALADYFGWYSLRTVSTFLITPLIKTPLLCLLPVALAALVVYNERHFLLRNLYIEEITRSTKHKISSNYTWLNRFGLAGELPGLDFKLILRNKRPRYVVLTSSIFLFYGFLFFQRSFAQNNVGIILLWSIIITGSYISQMAEIIYSSQCGHFDGLMAGNVPVKTYVRDKLTLLTLLSTVALLLSFFYGFINWKIIPIEIAAYFYNIGVNTMLCLYFGTMNYKAIDIEKGAVFRQSGMNTTRMLYSLAFAAVGAAIYFAFALLFNPWTGVAALGISGFAAFLLRENWLNIIATQFLRNKYKMLAGFREK